MLGAGKMVIFSFYKYSNDDRTFSGIEENSLKVSRTKKKKLPSMFKILFKK